VPDLPHAHTPTLPTLQGEGWPGPCLGTTSVVASASAPLRPLARPLQYLGAASLSAPLPTPSAAAAVAHSPSRPPLLKRAKQHQR
jgi:hypothetical protein